MEILDDDQISTRRSRITSDDVLDVGGTYSHTPFGWVMVQSDWGYAGVGDEGSVFEVVIEGIWILPVKHKGMHWRSVACFVALCDFEKRERYIHDPEI